jgi:hypothetical protein
MNSRLKSLVKSVLVCGFGIAELIREAKETATASPTPSPVPTPAPAPPVDEAKIAEAVRVAKETAKGGHTPPAKAKKTKKRGRKPKLIETTPNLCPVCNTIYIVAVRDLLRSKRTTCSTKCSYVYRGLGMRGMRRKRD